MERRYGNIAPAYRKPRVLIVTPEITYLPIGMGNHAYKLSAKAGGLADVSASLVSALYDMGADVHVAIPHYRKLFSVDVNTMMEYELRIYQRKLPQERLHLAEDRIFYYCDEIYGSYTANDSKRAMVFQREVINNIIPMVSPDLIHCNDWMTGLIPGYARRLGIPSLFTIHNVHTQKAYLCDVEEIGIDAAEFWLNLYYERPPSDYYSTRESIPIDLLTSGIFSAHFINTVSPTFLKEIVDGRHDFVLPHIRQEITNKFFAGCATGILNAPDESYDPSVDPDLPFKYSYHDHSSGKKKNKKALLDKAGFDTDDDGPVFFWPSRLDPTQKGCQLLCAILADFIKRHKKIRPKFIFVADGPFASPIAEIAHAAGLRERVFITPFDESLHRLAFAGSDFVLMPSLFEPCGLPQMIGAIYGSLPIARDTGGLHDTVSHLDVDSDTGNGFIFRDFDPSGLNWAMEQALAFFARPEEIRGKAISRIMKEAAEKFRHEVTAREYIGLYEKMLNRPLVESFAGGQ